MKRKWVLLKILIFVILLGFLLVFANNRYKIRELAKVDNKIDYSQGIYFITHADIDSVLKSTHPDYPKMQAQRISIKEMEDKLSKNPFIKNAQVYLENNGVLHTRIEQRIPVARVKDKNKEYYITQDSIQIPLCKTFSAKVLLVLGKIEKNDYNGIVQLTNIINNDILLKNLITGIKKIQKNSFILFVDDGRYVLDLGDLNNLEEKLHNFKVFHQEYIEKTAEMPYKKLNLKYNNQIVASK